MSEKHRVLQALQGAEDRGILNSEFKAAGILKPATRIQELRGEGHTIVASGAMDSVRYVLVHPTPKVVVVDALENQTKQENQ